MGLGALVEQESTVVVGAAAGGIVAEVSVRVAVVADSITVVVAVQVDRNPDGTAAMWLHFVYAVPSPCLVVFHGVHEVHVVAFVVPGIAAVPGMQVGSLSVVGMVEAGVAPVEVTGM